MPSPEPIAWDVVIAGEPRYRIDPTRDINPPRDIQPVHDFRFEAAKQWQAEQLALNGLSLLARKAST